MLWSGTFDTLLQRSSAALWRHKTEADLPTRSSSSRSSQLGTLRKKNFVLRNVMNLVTPTLVYRFLLVHSFFYHQFFFMLLNRNNFQSFIKYSATYLSIIKLGSGCADDQNVTKIKYCLKVPQISRVTCKRVAVDWNLLQALDYDFFSTFGKKTSHNTVEKHYLKSNLGLFQF